MWSCRALRNCHWVGDLWAGAMRAMELSGADDSEIAARYDAALQVDAGLLLEAAAVCGSTGTKVESLLSVLEGSIRLTSQHFCLRLGEQRKPLTFTKCALLHMLRAVVIFPAGWPAG